MNAFAQFFTAQQALRPRGLEVAAATENVIDINNLQFAWRNNAAPVLDIDNLRVERGQRLFIEGPSGSGKSTLLSLLAGVIAPQKGTVSVRGRRVDALSGAQRDRFRADHIGFIFQMFNLIPYLSLAENVALPCRFSQRRRQKAQSQSGGLEKEALRLLTLLGLADPGLLKRPVTDLSVGQQQRVAAARALIGSPEVLIADEPTSSLDAAHREAFIRLLFEECAKAQSTLIFVSHDTSLAPLFDQVIRLPEINRAGRRLERSGNPVTAGMPVSDIGRKEVTK
ncbi:MAG: ABC transporter ATP-binding protein [Deltaproteobacteria bacterium]|nr:MAG: ABC transporter ATP-binding protein [Deltaproteobacteria bacterium]